MTDKIFCPKCKSENTTIQNVIQIDKDGMGHCMMTVNFSILNDETQEMGRIQVPPNPYFCKDCNTSFEVETGKITKDAVIR